MTIDQETGEIIMPFLRTAYNYDTRAASREAALHTPEPSRTQQQFKEETDINTIVKRFGVTGELPRDVKVPISGDFTNVTDYQTAMNLVRQSQEAFMELPSNVRARFHNNPQELQAFVENKDNLDEARKLGLAVPPPPPVKPAEPTLVRVVADPPVKAE